MKLVLIITSSFMAVEFAAGIIAGSVALIADAGHMLIDAGALSLALFAMVYAQRPPTPKRTYGFYRAEILASLTNAAVLTALSIYVLYQAYQRIIEPGSPDSTIMVMVAVAGLAVNVVGLKLLGHSHEPGHASKLRRSLNIEAARLEVLSDALGSVAVIAAGGVIYITGLVIADPIVSIGLAIFIIMRARSLVKKAIHVLMEGVPHHIDYSKVKASIMGVKGVTGVFDLHIWTITPGMDAISAHVVIFDQARSQEILREITALLERAYGIKHATIQIEGYHPHSESEF